MPLFRNLFSLTRKEVAFVYRHAKMVKEISGLRLSQTGRPYQASLSDQSCGDSGKLLVVVPRRVGNAVVRNLIRRRLKSIFWEAQLYKQQGFSVVFVYPKAASFTFDQLRDFLIAGFKNLPVS